MLVGSPVGKPGGARYDLPLQQRPKTEGSADSRSCSPLLAIRVAPGSRPASLKFHQRLGLVAPLQDDQIGAGFGGQGAHFSFQSKYLCRARLGADRSWPRHPCPPGSLSRCARGDWPRCSERRRDPNWWCRHGSPQPEKRD